MIMNDETWHLVKHTNKVTGFVGGAKNRPAPISPEGSREDPRPDEEGTEKPRHKVEFVVGEFVRVKDGPFTDFNGTVEEVNYEKNKVRVSVTIFGRATPVELEFSSGRKDLKVKATACVWPCISAACLSGSASERRSKSR